MDVLSYRYALCFRIGGGAGGGNGHLSSFAEAEQLFGHWPRGFCLGERGRDALVFDEAAHQVGKHRIAMGTGAAEFGGTTKVTHGTLDFFCFRCRFEKRWVDVHTEGQTQGG